MYTNAKVAGLAVFALFVDPKDVKLVMVFGPWALVRFSPVLLASCFGRGHWELGFDWRVGLEHVVKIAGCNLLEASLQLLFARSMEYSRDYVWRSVDWLEVHIDVPRKF
jgi:hypothetical protein